MARYIAAIGGNVNRLLSGTEDGEVDVHQLNCTYYSAPGQDDDRYLAARAIQLFARGVPQIYYVGLLAGENDRAAVEEAGEGRAINRHNYSLPEIDFALHRPVVTGQLELIRLRNSHPAFEGDLQVETPSPSRMHLVWEADESRCSLVVDVSSGQLQADT